MNQAMSLANNAKATTNRPPNNFKKGVSKPQMTLPLVQCLLYKIILCPWMVPPKMPRLQEMYMKGKSYAPNERRKSWYNASQCIKANMLEVM